MDKAEKLKILKEFKKLYGEKFVHLCRRLCPIGYQKIDKLFDIIKKTFAPTHSLYEDITNDKNNITRFQTFLNQFFIKPKKLKSFETVTPEELFDEAGYILFPECKTDKDIQAFKKFYAKDEELCTFYEEDRINYYHIWFAIKKNVKDIKRKNFPHPEREDEYGTSVLCIQFRREKPNLLSIKNRYNHSVDDCDSTFDNDLDNIIPGLTNAFTKKYKFKLAKRGSQSFNLTPYTLASDGKLYRYNLERNNIYYCENNFIIMQGSPFIFDKNRCLLIENFILNLKKEELDIRDDTYCPGSDLNINGESNSFVQNVKNNTDNKIKKIEILNKENNEKLIKITTEGFEPVEITVNSHNQIVEYKNPNVDYIPPCFLKYNTKMRAIYLQNAKNIDHNFLESNTDLEIFYAPNVENIEKNFLLRNQSMKIFEARKLKTLAPNACHDNQSIIKIILPSIQLITYNCFYHNRSLEELVLNKDVDIGSAVLSWNPHKNELIEKATKSNEIASENIEQTDEVDELSI